MVGDRKVISDVAEGRDRVRRIGNCKREIRKRRRSEIGGLVRVHIVESLTDWIETVAGLCRRDGVVASDFDANGIVTGRVGIGAGGLRAAQRNSDSVERIVGCVSDLTLDREGRLPTGIKIIEAINCDSRLIAPVRVHQVELTVAVTRAGKDELRAVGRPGGVVIVGEVGGEPGLIAPIGVHHVNLKIENELLKARESDRAPSGDHVGSKFCAELFVILNLIIAVGIHGVDFQIAVAAADKSEMLAVGRPGRIKIIGRTVGQTCLISTVGIHPIDLEITVATTDKGDLAAVG